MKIIVSLAIAVACAGCTVISVTGSVVSRGVSVAGPVVQTGAGVAGSAVRGVARAVTPSDKN